MILYEVRFGRDRRRHYAEVRGERELTSRCGVRRRYDAERGLTSAAPGRRAISTPRGLERPSPPGVRARRSNRRGGCRGFGPTAGGAAASAWSDVVLEWNEVALDTLRVDRAGVGRRRRRGAWRSCRSRCSTPSTRSPARPSRSSPPRPRRPPHAARRRRRQRAAHDALLDLYPQQKAALDAALAETLDRVPDGKGRAKGREARRQGLRGLVLAARAMTAATSSTTTRSSSSIRRPTSRRPSTSSRRRAEITPGEWRPDPLNPTQKNWA